MWWWLSEQWTTPEYWGTLDPNESFNRIIDSKKVLYLPSETEADVCVSNVFNIQMNFQRDTKLIYEQIWELHKPHTHTHTPVIGWLNIECWVSARVGRQCMLRETKYKTSSHCISSLVVCWIFRRKSATPSWTSSSSSSSLERATSESA